uniref:Uncharacterized protein n=1 Tax=Entomoneis paludosa TaxID=265537 RepID=A0A7S3DUN3_9STRA|mmetsp:Transcript_37697/g.78211  ORF Transcript_37697/g.78211 Transcript_37697/m.78211 type:complete len:114 (+) Transcript_37697:3-344(+)
MSKRQDPSHQPLHHSELPPLLLYWFSGLDAYLILDGHDRLLAACLEPSVPNIHVICLDAVEPQPPATWNTTVRAQDRAWDILQRGYAAVHQDRLRGVRQPSSEIHTRSTNGPG